mgnify:CR=1 FL=1
MAQSKVLSLFGSKDINSLFEDIELLGKPKDVFYEVQSYNILVSVYQDNNEKSNIFEETILKLLSIKELSIEKISEKLCLEKAFIKYLVESLEIKGLIDEKMEVTSYGRNLLDSYDRDEKKITQKLLKIFVDIKTKQILPFIYTDIENFETESIENETKDRLEIKVGNKTDETIIKGKKIISNEENISNNFTDDKNIQKISKSNYSSSSSEEKTINRIITDKDLKNNKKEEEDREDRFEEITDRTNRITALGSAMGAVDLSKTPANKFRVGAGVGQSAKNQAVAVGIGYAPTERLRLNTKISTTTNSTGSNRSNGISIGASYDLDW